MIRHTVWFSGLEELVVGLSGGIDSAVAAALCCRAVGPEQVLGVSLPTLVTPPSDMVDAADLAAALGIHHIIQPIDPILAAYGCLEGYRATPYLNGNLMARIRMTVLYYHANRDHRLVCGTSNRTEYLLGYCTKFGDNAADLQPLLHLYKGDVYTLAADFPIPPAIISKPPSAGLWHGQSDEQELGLSYPIIDAALRSLQAHQWVASGLVEEQVLAKVKNSTHKRVAGPNLLAGHEGPQ